MSVEFTEQGFIRATTQFWGDGYVVVAGGVCRECGEPVSGDTKNPRQLCRSCSHLIRAKRQRLKKRGHSIDTLDEYRSVVCDRLGLTIDDYLSALDATKENREGMGK